MGQVCGVPDDAVCGTAGDESHKVVEIGDCFPLTEIRRVNSFGRPLVSARYLVDKFDEVRFDRHGVHLVSNRWNTQRTTQNGKEEVGRRQGRRQRSQQTEAQRNGTRLPYT